MPLALSQKTVTMALPAGDRLLNFFGVGRFSVPIIMTFSHFSRCNSVLRFFRLTKYCNLVSDLTCSHQLATELDMASVCIGCISAWYLPDF
jgi:hypothetical protein